MSQEVSLKRIVVIAIAAIFAVSTVAFAEYNKDATVKVMRDNIAAFGKLRTAAGGADYAGAADALMVIAGGSLKLLAADPPKGQKADWDAVHRDMAKAALKGVDAALDRNKAGLDAAVVDVGNVQKRGHSTFR
jgi:hypothetical protein